MLAGIETQAAQAQRNGIKPSDKAKIKGEYPNSPPLILFMEKANSGRATPVFLLTPPGGKSRSTKFGLAGRKTGLLEPIL